MPTTTKPPSKTVFDLLADLADERHKISQQAEQDKARVREIDGEILALQASIVRSGADHADVQPRLDKLNDEKAAVEARIAAVPAARSTIAGDERRLRDERRQEFVDRAEQVAAEGHAAFESFLAAGNRLFAARQQVFKADADAGIAQRPGFSRSRFNLGAAIVDPWAMLAEAGRIAEALRDGKRAIAAS